MTEDNEPRIPFAIEPRSKRLVHIEEAFRGKLYFCEKCNERLTAKLGDIRKHHFAHHVDATTPCPLHNVIDIKNYENEVRISHIDEYEKSYKMRLILYPEAYDNNIELFGIIPSMKSEDIAKYASLDSALSDITVEGYGCFQLPSQSQFHPRKNEVQIKLIPNQEDYQINISTKVSTSINGKWKSNGISDQDIFTGEPFKAEKLHSKEQITMGDQVFIVLKNIPKTIPKYSTIYELSNWNVISFILDKSSKSFLFKYLDEKYYDDNNFNVDIIKPISSSPSPVYAIETVEGNEVIFSITPPESLDPIFEIIPIPFNDMGMVEIKRMGKGKPRMINEIVNNENGKRLNIHWGGRHKIITIQTNKSDKDNDLQLGFSGPKIYLTSLHDNKQYYPWYDDEVILPELDEKHSISKYINLQLISNIKFSIIGYFPEKASFSPLVRIENVDIERAIQNIDVWIDEGCYSFKFDFDSIGSLSCIVKSKPPWKTDTSIDEIKRKLLELEKMPHKINWAFIRSVYDIPLGTQHKECPSGVKKKFRKALKEVKEG